VTIDYLSPMNEPTHLFEQCGQEGMGVPVGTRDDIVRAVGTQLAARVPTTGITSDESSAASGFVSEVPQWLSTSGTARHVSRLAHHTYDFPSNGSLNAAADVGRRFGKPTWATEICCFSGINTGWGQQYDPTIVSGLAMSDIIHRDFTQANSSAFHWWTAVSKMMGCSPAANPACATGVNSAGWNDGLIYYDANFAGNGNQALYLTKRFYALGQYSRFVRPGAVRHPAGVQITAFNQGGTRTLVVNNLNTAASTVDVTVNGVSALRPVSAHRTSGTQNLAQIGNPPVSGNTVSLSLPARSVTTYVFGP
jgi:O-glycosyl hydrolase